jgi:hypothetical protein
MGGLVLTLTSGERYSNFTDGHSSAKERMNAMDILLSPRRDLNQGHAIPQTSVLTNQPPLLLFVCLYIFQLELLLFGNTVLPKHYDLDDIG